MATSIVWASAMRWKECQPISKCHSLLFWIPALLCATDLNWVNITCGAPLGPSVHARVCERMHVCMHVCEHGNECFKTRFLAFHRIASKTLEELCDTLPGVRHNNGNFQWLKTSPIGRKLELWFKSVPTYYLTKLRAGECNDEDYVGVIGTNWSPCGLTALCVTYAWLWCNAAEAGVSRWSFHRLIDADNNKHNSQRFCP